VSLVDIVITLTAAGAGGTVAWLAWRLSGVLGFVRVRPGSTARAGSTEPAAAPQADDPRVGAPDAAPPKAEARRTAPQQRAEPAAPPDFMERLDSLKADIATLAQAQLAMLEGRAEQESRFLAEMRAIAGTPELASGLARIEAALTTLSSHLTTTDATPAGPAQARTAHNEVFVEDAADQPPQPQPQARPQSQAQPHSHPQTPRAEGARDRDDSLVSMLDHARNSPRTGSAAEPGPIGRRGLGPAE